MSQLSALSEVMNLKMDDSINQSFTEPSSVSNALAPSHAVCSRILFIGGYGRSGSTLLDLLLGQIDGFVSVGEMRYIWEWGLRDNLLCGCGEPFLSCPFWTEVLREVFGSISNIDPERMIRLKRHVERTPNVLCVLAPQLLAPRHNQEYDEYSQIMQRLYKAILAVSGARIVVDSSKHPSRGLLVSSMETTELNTIHLVRDCRAVVYSWQKKCVRPEVQVGTQHMDRHGLWRCVGHWLGHNRLVASLRTQSNVYLFIRYEDLVAKPQETLQKIVGSIGEAATDFAFFEPGEVRMKINHTVAGNPMRFAKGSMRIKLDDEWKSKLSRTKQFLVTSLTWPQLVRYGYPIMSHIICKNG